MKFVIKKPLCPDISGTEQERGKFPGQPRYSLLKPAGNNRRDGCTTANYKAAVTTASTAEK